MEQNSERPTAIMGIHATGLQALHLPPKSNTRIVIAAVHVDDFLSIATSKDENKMLKAEMCTAWKISKLGTPHFVVDIAIC
jgi:hypothetical protein